MDFEWSDKRVLVTGATGFLARHLIPVLLENGAKLVGMSLEKDYNLNLKNFSYTYVDLKDKKRLNEEIKKIKPKIIFHLAAYPDKEPTFENTDSCIQNNIQGTLNLIHSLRDTGFESFIHIGSYKEYSGTKLPFKETDAVFPISSYAISKACTEMFCKAYYKIYGLPIILLRLPTVYGPGQSEQNLVPYLIKSSLAGNTLKLTKCEQKRELIYVSDAVDALLKAGVSKEAYGEIINIGTGEEYTLKEVVNMVLRLTNSKTKPEFGAVPYRKNEIWSMRGDNSKAKSILKWEPKTSMEEGLITTIASYKNDSGKN